MLLPVLRMLELLDVSSYPLQLFVVVDRFGIKCLRRATADDESGLIHEMSATQVQRAKEGLSTLGGTEVKVIPIFEPGCETYTVTELAELRFVAP